MSGDQSETTGSAGASADSTTEATDPPTHAADPPSYDGLPIVGNTHQMVRGQNAFYERTAELGDVVHIQLLGIGDLYQVSHPDLVGEVLVRSRDDHGKASISKDQLGELLGDGLVLSEGDLWQRQRQRVQPAFYRDRIAEYAGDRPKFAYFPFGGGPRRCVGEQFALVEGKLLLATLASRYSPELASDPDVDVSVSVTTRPVDPIDIRLDER